MISDGGGMNHVAITFICPQELDRTVEGGMEEGRKKIRHEGRKEERKKGTNEATNGRKEKQPEEFTSGRTFSF